MRTSMRAGLTLTEYMIAFVICAALVGIVVPVLVIEHKRSQLEIALVQVEQMGSPVLSWIRDIRGFEKETKPSVYAGPGSHPEKSGNDLGDFLTVMTQADVQGMSPLANWKGPYLSKIPIDPWGHSYLLVGIGKTEEHTWVLTAGPDGVLETNSAHASLQGDDLGIRLR